MKQSIQISLIGASLMLAAGTSALVAQTPPVAESQIVWSFDPEAMGKEPAVVFIRPSAAANPGAARAGMMAVSEGTLALGTSLRNIVGYAYGIRPPARSRIIMPADAPGGAYDFIDTILPDGKTAMQQLLKQQFGLTARHEKRAVDVLVMTVKTSNAPGLKLNAGDDGGGGSGSQEGINGDNSSMSMIADQLAGLLGQPVIDQTALAGRYDFTLLIKPGAPAEAVKKAVADQLGLDLAPGGEKQPVDYLVVQKSN